MTSNETDMDTQIERLMLESWLPVAEKHVESSGGDIAVLDIDPEQYPEQQLDRFHIPGNPQQPDVIKMAASFVEPRFEAISQAFYDDPKSAEALEQAGELLDTGKNLIVATNHAQLPDVAVVQAAVYSYLKRQEREFSSSIIISKMISLLASNKLKDENGHPMPGLMALQILCDDVYMSYPKTDTTSKTALAQSMPEVIKSHNQTVSAEIAKRLGEGGMLLAMCPSGTTDKLEEGADVCTLQKVQSGTAKLMAHPNTHVLPIAAYFDENPFVKAAGDVRQLSSPDEAHDAMRSIARTLDQEIAEIDFRYR